MKKEQKITQDRVVVITGFSLFLFGTLVNAISTMKLKDLNEEVRLIAASFLLLSVLFVILAIMCGGLMFMKVSELGSPYIDHCNLIHISIICLISAIAFITVALALIVTESLKTAIIYLSLFIGGLFFIVWKIWKNARYENININCFEK